MAYKWGLLTILTKWDDPPSVGHHVWILSPHHFETLRIHDRNTKEMIDALLKIDMVHFEHVHPWNPGDWSWKYPFDYPTFTITNQPNVVNIPYPKENR